MWSGTRYYRGLFRYVDSLSKICKNRFMSDAFKCETAWNNRLKSTLLQKVNSDDMFNDMEVKYNQTKSISAVDVDIFVNSVKDDVHIDEMEEVVYRLRLTSEATNIFPSTHHAFIRTYLAHGNSEELMRILNDRLNYGIFPDDFCSILLMDYFIDKRDYKNAANIATLQMLQEDFYNDFFKYLSLYSCCKFLLNPSQWEQKEEETPNDSGEEVKVRVKYLRNPYFDNHFDLREPNALIGKTFGMICEDLNSNIINDIKFISNNLLKEWNIAKDFINRVKDNKISITRTTVDIVESIITNENNDEDTKNEVFEMVKNGLAMLKQENLVSDINLLDVLEGKIKDNIMIGENIAQGQIKIYEEWENNRETALREEIEKLNVANKLELIKKKKQEILEKEQKIFFFERENEIDIAIENKRVRYPPKWLGKKKKPRATDVEYIPPEVTKQRTSS